MDPFVSFVGPLGQVDTSINIISSEMYRLLIVFCILCTFNSMFVRLGTDYEIRNGGYFESIKNSANQFISKP